MCINQLLQLLGNVSILSNRSWRRTASMKKTKSIPLSLSQALEALQRVPASFEFKQVRHRLSFGFPSSAADSVEDGLGLN